MTYFISAFACNTSGVSDVKIMCEGITPQTPTNCSFNEGPLHSCENIVEHHLLIFLKSMKISLTGTLPLVLNSDVSPPGNHSVIIVAYNAEVSVSYRINEAFEPQGT